MADYKVLVSAAAEQDILSIVQYISVTLRESLSAERTYHAIKAIIMSLGNMPDRHGIVHEEPFAEVDVRKLFVENYTVFYIVDEDKKAVHIIRVLYNRREWQHLLEKE